MAKIQSSLDHTGPNTEEIYTGKWRTERALEGDRMGMGGSCW